MSLRAEPWWASCVARVATESLERLAREFRVEVEDLAEALADDGRGGPAQQAPWWPEAIRELESGVSIRSVARRFRTEPRRIRRALARTAIRAGGTGFGPDGLPVLAEFVDRLGKEPDIKIAAAAHVAVEAVQGERRRRGIPAYQQRRTRRAKLSADDMQWIRGPKRNRREKFKPEADVQVVRRPVRNEPAPPTLVVRRSLDGDRGHFEASPRGESPRGEVLTRGEALSRGPVRPAWTPRTEEPPPPPRPYERPWVKSERQEEIDQLLSVQRRQRDGRQRIVRAESQRPELAEPERSPRVIRRTSGAPGTTWRAVDPSYAPPAEPITPPKPAVEARPQPVIRHEPVIRPEPVARPAVDVRPAPPPVVVVQEPAPRPVVVEPPRPADPPAVRRVVRPEPPAAAFTYPPIPPSPVQMVAEPVAPPAPKVREPRPKAMAARASTSVRPGHVEVLPPQVDVHPPDPVRAAPVAWYVEVPDGAAPFVLYAADITEALVAASARLAPELLARACIWRVGEPRPAV